MSVQATPSFYRNFGKQAFDRTAAGLGFLVLFPFLLMVGVAVRLTSNGPVLFRQTRVGRFGRPFELLKFRSMYVGSEKGSGLTASGDPRVTPFGRWLRRSKVDELPQLWNVIRGDMSLVGPRPEVPDYVAHYSERQRQVLIVRPGITGPEINVYEEELLAGQEDKEQYYINTLLGAKLELDLAYIQNVDFSSDLSALTATFKKLLIRVHEPYKAPGEITSTNS